MATFKRQWAFQLSGAVAALYAVGVVHSDIKAANFFLTDAWPIQLGVFGVAVDTLQGLSYSNGTTPMHCPPEYLYSFLDEVPFRVAPPFDVWPLGLVFYHMESLKQPISVEDPGPWAVVDAINSFVDKKVETLKPIKDPYIKEAIMHALEANPEDRWSAATVRGVFESSELGSEYTYNRSYAPLPLGEGLGVRGGAVAK